MTKTQTLSLGHYWNGFIEKEIKIGRYSSASEIIRDALRLLEERETKSKLESLRMALIEGEESGFVEYDLKSIKKEAKKLAKKKIK